MSDAVQRIRLARSAAILVALVVVAAVAGTWDKAESSSAAVARAGGIDARALVGDADALGFAGRLEAAAAAPQVQLSAAFEDEVGLPPRCRDVRSDAGGSVVGCVLDAACDEALGAVKAQMAGRGWREVALGGLEGATFVKEGGACSWVLVTCTQVGGATDVVYRCAYRDN